MAIKINLDSDLTEFDLKLKLAKLSFYIIMKNPVPDKVT